MATVAATMTSPPAPKGRKRKAADADIDEKPRGRPRKNSKDESAAERRRTQIRLAQRAYRQRKETTIDELRQRVSELTTTVEMMNRSLRDFAQTATKRGLPDETRSDLDELVQKLAPYVMTARNPGKFTPSDDDSAMPNISAVSVDPINGSYNDATISPEEENHIDIGMGYALMMENQQDNQRDSKQGSPNSYEAPQAATAFGPEVFPNLRTDARSYEQPVPTKRIIDQQQRHSPSNQTVQRSPEMLTEEQQLESQLQHIGANFLNTPQYESALIPRSQSLSPVHSYSYYEKSFSRRLQRRCIETGWELLNNPTIAPSTYNRVFRLTQLLGRSHSAMVHAFSLALRRTINDALDSHVSPFTSIGGAGLHYPSHESGPRRPLTRTDSTMTLDAIASSIPGYEGEWLDPQDVQGYLHDLGINVNGQASFVHSRLPIAYLTTPSHLVAAEAYMASLNPANHSIEEAEIFHRQFLDRGASTSDPVHFASATAAVSAVTSGQVPTPRPSPNANANASGNGNLDLASMGLWNNDLGNLDLGSLTDILDSPALNFFTIPGTASYEAASPEASRGGAESAGSHSSEGMGGGSRSEANSSEGKIGCGSSVTSVSSVESAGVVGRKDGDAGERLNVTLDVGRLMKGLILGSVCLGRAPGFRRELVDAAVRASVVMSF
ncbi:hypothetical protein C1H76_1971 [Elsinoe australis]|uniref:BZIP domain-containing protein n=1 Tax=Elsinoe australis TaxID=40998 RepID=A0A4U7B7R3_9PEZI|nr:hypothetical protein C1H76_1971 [Elsinoe australis]